MQFSVKPMTLKMVNEFVEQNHRHNKKVTGHRFSIGAEYNSKLVGVAICGRPVARKAPQVQLEIVMSVLWTYYALSYN